MSESVTVKLEVVASPSFKLSVDKHNQGGVIGDTVVYKVACHPVGAFTGNVQITVSGAPSGAAITYSPSNRTIAYNGVLTVSIDTTGCSEAVSELTFTGAEA